jgi:hydrogenase 3 maturation protease
LYSNALEVRVGAKNIMTDRGWVRDLQEIFQFCYNRNLVHLIGVGNTLRRDDGAGIEVARKLRRVRASNELCKIYPPSDRVESIISKIDYSAGQAVIVDAADFNSSPGSIICGAVNSIRTRFFVTHNIPINALPGVSSHLDRIMILGIQPKDIGVGEGFSPPVAESINQIVRVLSELVRRGN